MTNRTLFWDTETRSVDDRWSYPPREFVRTLQYAWGRDGAVQIETDYDRMLGIVESADLLIAHNAHAFDLSVLYGKDSTRPLELALERKVLDTMVWTAVTDPPPTVWTDRFGHTHYDGDTPRKTLKWLGLEETNTRLGLPGKFGDLKELAAVYGGFDQIPLDDPDFLAYAEQDVVAVRALAIHLLEQSDNRIPEYVWREQLFAAICAQNSRNGFAVDAAKARNRVSELTARREAILADLTERYELPTDGKAPWATAKGKAAILGALAEHGIAPETVEWPRTPTGAPKLGGDELIALTEDTPAADLGVALAELKGQRSLAQLALDCLQPDGMVHPEITMLQRSGRLSTTKPGLTVWTSRGDGAVEKSYFVARPGYKLIEFDYSQADARIVAAYSGDEKFKERFAEGVDAHELTGRLVFGHLYDEDPSHYRQIAKALGHAYAYRAGAKKLAATSKQPFEVAKKFVDTMNRAYPKVRRWQDEATDRSRSGWITNDWGRRMRVDPDRAFTQAPALLGQSGTRELIADALIRMCHTDLRIVTWLKAQIHDALLFEIPVPEIEWAITAIKACMETTWQPRYGAGQPVEFIVGVGSPADTWQEASH